MISLFKKNKYLAKTLMIVAALEFGKKRKGIYKWCNGRIIIIIVILLLVPKRHQVLKRRRRRKNGGEKKREKRNRYYRI